MVVGQLSQVTLNNVIIYDNHDGHESHWNFSPHPKAMKPSEVTMWNPLASGTFWTGLTSFIHDSGRSTPVGRSTACKSSAVTSSGGWAVFFNRDGEILRFRNISVPIIDSPSAPVFFFYIYIFYLFFEGVIVLSCLCPCLCPCPSRCSVDLHRPLLDSPIS